MTDDYTHNYTITGEKDRMVFRTTSFRAEKSSVLHEGVYTKEFSSMLCASAVCLTAYMLFVFFWYVSFIQYVLLVILFILSFLGSKKFIFKDSLLEVDFNRKTGKAEIIKHGIFTRKIDSIPFENITSVESGRKEFVPENMDGIKFVQKISAQHGSAVPELDRAEAFVTISLKLINGGERVIYAGKTGEEPLKPVEKIRGFLENSADTGSNPGEA